MARHVPAAGEATSANQKYGGPPFRSQVGALKPNSRANCSVILAPGLEPQVPNAAAQTRIVSAGEFGRSGGSYHGTSNTAAVSAILRLNELGWGSKRISRELGISRNTVKEYIAAGGWTQEAADTLQQKVSQRGQERPALSKR